MHQTVTGRDKIKLMQLWVNVEVWRGDRRGVQGRGTTCLLLPRRTASCLDTHDRCSTCSRCWLLSEDIKGDNSNNNSEHDNTWRVHLFCRGEQNLIYSCVADEAKTASILLYFSACLFSASVCHRIHVRCHAYNTLQIIEISRILIHARTMKWKHNILYILVYLVKICVLLN